MEAVAPVGAAEMHAAEAADAVVMMASDAPPDAAKAMLEELATNMEKTNE